MPYRITLPFEMGNKAPCSDMGRVLCANLYAWIEAGDARVAETIHEDSGPKPFTLSPPAKLRDGLRSLHVTLLDDALWPTLLAGLQSRPRVNILGHDFPLAPMGMQMDYATYHQLARERGSDRYINLRFVTPTCFRAGDLDYPLPEPRSLYTSWLSQWTRYAPATFAMSEVLLETVWQHVGISACDIETSTVSLGYGKQVGFLGTVALCIVKANQLDRSVRQQLHVLASYSEYCGSGIKTTHGMGQTRRVSWHGGRH